MSKGMNDALSGAQTRGDFSARFIHAAPIADMQAHMHRKTARERMIGIDSKQSLGIAARFLVPLQKGKKAGAIVQRDSIARRQPQSFGEACRRLFFMVQPR